MPRTARLDWPGALHHVIGRGIERRRIFHSDRDRRDMLRRLADVVTRADAAVYAWCLMPNHFHLLFRTGALPLSRCMQRWLGGYVTCFNHRHQRSGHLFQNRFKNVLVEEEPYLVELVRYIHLNPVRSKLPVTVDSLDTYPWTGHAALLGKRQLAGQDVDFVLERFGNTAIRSRKNYRDFIRAGALQRDFSDLNGGGLRRSAGEWEHVARVERGRERWAFDERVLGSSAFVHEVLERNQLETRRQESAMATPSEILTDLCSKTVMHHGLSLAELGGRSCRRDVLLARSEISITAVRQYGLSLTDVGRHLGLSVQSVARAVARGDSLKGTTV